MTVYRRALTAMQAGMVFHYLANPDSGVDVEQIVITLDERVDQDCLRKAWTAVLGAQPLFCSRLVRDEQGEPWLEAQDSPPVSFEVLAPDANLQLETLLSNDRNLGFALFEQPPWRVTLAEIDGCTTCLWTFHHVLCDGRNFAALLVAVFDAYDALVAQGTAVAPVLTDHLPYLEWLQQQSSDASLPYWRELLDGADLPAPSIAVGTQVGRRRTLEYAFSGEQTTHLNQWAEAHGATLNVLVQAAWAVLLGRMTGADDVLFGVTRAGRAGAPEGAADMLGVFINTVPVRAQLGSVTTEQLVQQLRAQSLQARAHETVPLADIGRSQGVHGGLFDSLVMFDREILDHTVRQQRPGWQQRTFTLYEHAPYTVTVYCYAAPVLTLRFAFDDGKVPGWLGERCLENLKSVLLEMTARDSQLVDDLRVIADAERRQLLADSATTRRPLTGATIEAMIRKQCQAEPDAIALTAAGRTMTYAELDACSDALAAQLQGKGVGAESVVGISLARGIELVIAVLGVLKSGGAYLPLDPGYPAERLRYCSEDADVKLVITSRRYAPRFQRETLLIETLDEMTRDQPETCDDIDRLAYLIYTSGSTGNPKGVMVSQRNVSNFFLAMDEEIPVADKRRWLAVTSLSFDISVLELLWTLTRGFNVVLHNAEDPDARQDSLKFSLFYFANEPGDGDADPYRMVMAGARFADEHGFEAIYTPERHFHGFGGLYPNPSVMGAAIAAVTRHVGIRSGSVVLPLHSPFRVAEEWSLVDNLSHGRVALSFASGWQPNDFVLAPENYEQRTAIMFDNIEKVRRLWRGEQLDVVNPKGDKVSLGILPLPVQDELPVWITTAGNPDSWRSAGRIGANILTHLLGQTVADIEEKVAIYRQARADAGHDPDGGEITLMLHTFIGEDADAVRELVREPMREYLRGSASLVGQYADAWTAYKGGATGVGETALSDLAADEMEQLLDFAFERYFHTSALFGTAESCTSLVDGLMAAGVTEIACLIDFGVATDTVLAHLPYINELRELIRARGLHDGPSLAEDIANHDISHLQTTPSLARMLLLQAGEAQAVNSLEHLMVGGEALSQDLFDALQALLPDTAIHNMYGPTETTIWSTVKHFSGTGDTVTIGAPIANTQCYCLDHQRRLVPLGCEGELVIGGEGVTRGYYGREELTRQVFMDDHLTDSGQRLYATGDRVRRLADGELVYSGRRDDQVKLRGHRIELGEIEARLREHPDVSAAAAAVRIDSAGTSQLLAYVVAGTTAPDGASLREHVRSQLPDFMVPNRVLVLDSLPLTPNGKLDRNALPALEESARVSAQMPRNDIEAIIAQVWRDVLRLDSVGIHESFFDVGGHSILAVKMQGQLSQQFRVQVAVIDLFRHPTIAEFAALMVERLIAQATAAEVDAVLAGWQTP